MKNTIIVILALALAVTVVLLAGCSSEESTTPSETEDMQTMDESEDMQATEGMDEDSEMTEEDMGPSTYVDVTPAEARQMIDGNPDLIVIDVSPHYAEGHLPGAVSYPLDDGSLDKAIPTLNKNAPYLVYCHVDSVAIAGAQKLIDAGFKEVYRLEGNYAAWVNAGYPVER